MSQNDDKVVYPKLQGAINYRSWKQNMISLFKKERAFEIATGQAPKPAEPAYPNDLTKLQFKELEKAARTAAAAAQAASQASSSGSATITPQSGESAAPPAPPATPELTRDELEDAYQAYLREWEIHEKWLERDSKAYDIMRRHTEDDCKPTLGTGTSFEAWSAVENTYRVITYAPIIEAFEKVTSQRSETSKTKAALTASIQQSITEFCELASVSSTFMRDLEPLFLYQALGSEFYHLKEQIKAMKQSEVDPEKIRSLINGHSVINPKPPASASFTSSSSRKRKSGQEGQSGQSKSNKRRRTDQGGQSGEPKDPGTAATVKKCGYCHKLGHLEQDCWSKDPSKRPQRSKDSSQPNPAAASANKG
jgi:hypothetical protein